MGGVLEIAASIEKIGDAADGIARVITAKLGIPEALRPDLRHADEIVGRVKGPRGGPVPWGVAPRAHAPDRDEPVAHRHPAGRGVGVSTRGVRSSPRATFSCWEPPGGRQPHPRAGRRPPHSPGGPDSEPMPLTEVGRAVDILVEMKNSAEGAVGLAYSALLFREPALAAEVTTLETRSDTLHGKLESWVLRAAYEYRRPRSYGTAPAGVRLRGLSATPPGR